MTAKLIKRGTFHGPMGTVEYELRVATHGLYQRARDVLVDDKVVGRIVEAPVSQPRYWHPKDHFGNCGTQYTAAEYVIMWNWIKNMSRCPYCKDEGFYESGQLYPEDGSFVARFKCSVCGARQSAQRWPPTVCMEYEEKPNV